MTIYKGIFPVAPTIFNANGSMDIEGQKRCMDLMVDQGNDGLCILANYSEQFLLSDEERDIQMDVCLEQIGGRIPVIVTTSHFSTDIAIERAKRAEAAGASMLMMMPPYHGAALKCDDTGMFEYFSRVSDAINIPIMIQDAPLSGVNMSVDLLARMANKIENVKYFKIETAGTASKLRALITKAGASVEGPFDGEEAITLMADLDAGATGTMTSAMIPDLIKHVIHYYLKGERQSAFNEYNRLLPLINFENRQCGLRSAKTVMMEGGVIKSDFVRAPMEQLSPETRAQLLELALIYNPLALRWGK